MVSDSGIKAERPTQDGFRGFVRSLSGKNVLASPPTTSVSVQEVTEEPEPNPIPATPSMNNGEPLQRTPSASSSIKKAKEKISDRLKQLGKDIGKLRKSSDKSVPASPRITVGDVQTHRNSPSSSYSTPTLVSPPNLASGHAKLLSMVVELAEESAESETVVSAGAPSPKSPSDAQAPPEASTLAKRIQDLVDALPFPNPMSKPVPKNPKPPARDAEGRPIPPADATPIHDSRLIKFLSSPTIMNGSTLKGRPSIWSVLELLGSPAHGFPPTDQEDVDNGNSGNTSDGTNNSDSNEGHSIYSDNSSVMVYSPLIPTLDDHVELAELVPVGEDEHVASPESQTAIFGTSWTTIWPLSLWYTPSNEPKSARMTGEIILSPTKSGVDLEGRVVSVQSTTRAWVPSTSKLSVQALWWGYRLYLPPPVLDILSDKTLEATKRAAMITTALTWFFNNLPVDSLPPQVRPAALLLQRLAPYLGYIGTFISWSWSTIKSYDIGYGVTLTATWLLPVALIPGTWRENDFPKSPSQNPIPLPPQSPPTNSTPLPPASSPPTTMTPPFTTAPSSPNPVSASEIQSPLAVVSVTVPVPPTPADIAPVPPNPVPAPIHTRVPVAVPLGSRLMEELLHGPVLAPVPLPDEDAPVPETPRPKKDAKSRAKALFTRSSKQWS